MRVNPISEDRVKQIASCLEIDDAAKIEHLRGRVQRYAGGYLAARRGLRIRLSPAGPRSFMLSVAGHINALEADLTKLATMDEVVAQCRTGPPAGTVALRCSLDEVSNQLRFLRELVLNCAETGSCERSQKGLSILDHAVGSFMALFAAVTDEPAGAHMTEAGGDVLDGRAGLSLQQVFQDLDPAVRTNDLEAAVIRLNLRFHGRALQERDFDWISAIEDDGGFNVGVLPFDNRKGSEVPL